MDNDVVDRSRAPASRAAIVETRVQVRPLQRDHQPVRQRLVRNRFQGADKISIKPGRDGDLAVGYRLLNVSGEKCLQMQRREAASQRDRERPSVTWNTLRDLQRFGDVHSRVPLGSITPHYMQSGERDARQGVFTGPSHCRGRQEGGALASSTQPGREPLYCSVRSIQP